jgi:MFS family permease
MPPDKYRWTILILSYLCMLGYAFSMQALPPVLPLVIHDMKLMHAEAGSLMSFFALPAIFLSIFAGLFADRWGSHHTGVAALILIIAGISIFAFSTSFPVAGAGRIIAGMGAVTISIVSAQLISQWFRGKGLGMAMGIFNTAMPVGTIICFTTFGKLGEMVGWRIPILISAALGAMGLIAFLILYKAAPEPASTNTVERAIKTGFLRSFLTIGISIWLVGLCWMWFNSAVISFSTFAPDFFVSKGYSISNAGLLASFLMWGSLGLSPAIGYLVDRFDRRELFIGIGGIIIALAIWLVMDASHVLIPMIVMAVAVAFVPTPIFSFPSKILKDENLGLGFGIISMLSSIGIFFAPFVTGLLRDQTGSYRMSFIFLTILSLLITVTAVVLMTQTRRGARIPVDH